LSRYTRLLGGLLHFEDSNRSGENRIRLGTGRGHRARRNPAADRGSDENARARRAFPSPGPFRGRRPRRRGANSARERAHLVRAATCEAPLSLGEILLNFERGAALATIIARIEAALQRSR
jgi:hypothetical protein